MQKAKINAARLVMQSVAGAVRHPSMGNPYRIDHEGVPHILPATGAITYNVKVGDSVYAMECDHVEPGVTVRNPDAQENAAFNTLSCIGNTAIVISGDAKGARGFVTGTHGGVEHVLCYFPEDALDKLAIGDRIQVRAQGQGMKIEGFEDTVFCMNLDPNLFEKMNVTVEDGKLIVPIAARVPAYLMGSGIGAGSAANGDYDIMTADHAEIARLGLDRLRYGDFVLLEDCDTSFGRGLVVHSDCVKMGHGPGVTTIFTSKTPVLEGRLEPHANLADYMGI